ncbi:MAG: ribosome maturation factor RimM [Bacteroidota bacterium]
MTKDECFELGYITRSHGLDGEASAVLDTDVPQRYRNLKAVFVEIRGALVPYELSSVKLNGAKATLKFTDVKTAAAADALKGSVLWLPVNMLPPLKGKAFYFHELPGLRVQDEFLGELGTVSSVYDLPHQDLLGMDYKGSEILIPLNEDIVKGINREAGEIYTRLPEGLLEVYMAAEGDEDTESDDADDETDENLSDENEAESAGS